MVAVVANCGVSGVEAEATSVSHAIGGSQWQVSSGATAIVHLQTPVTIEAVDRNRCQSPLQVTHKRCPGAILPGLSDQLVVEFCPVQLRYYYDTIRVHSSVSVWSFRGGLWLVALILLGAWTLATHAAAVA